MTDGWNVTEGDPWSVTFRPMEDTRVVRLHVGNFTIVLPALEAHKLGSALHAASGLDAGSELPADEPIPHYHDDALLTLRLAAGVLSVSYSTLTKWTARGEFCPEAFKLPNGEYRVRYRDLIRWALTLRSTS